MYTLLLVDDEEEVTRIIAKKVKWNDLGFSVTGHANNGLKALEMLEEMQPDVVMTDIRMPYMDGLELCGQIREKYPATKLVYLQASMILNMQKRQYISRLRSMC